MPKQVSIKWDSGMEHNYGASVDALREYTPPPDLSASIRLKGSVDETVVEAIAELADHALARNPRHADGDVAQGSGAPAASGCSVRWNNTGVAYQDAGSGSGRRCTRRRQRYRRDWRLLTARGGSGHLRSYW